MWSEIGKILYEFRHFFLEVIPLALIALYLRRAKRELKATVGELGERIDTLKQQVQATQQTAEDALSRSTAGVQTVPYWDQVRNAWQETRNRIELAIEEIRRKNTREKYSRFTRYRYAKIIRTLERDAIIDQRLSIILQQMELEFLRMRARPENTTAADAAQFDAWQKSIGNGLPMPDPTTQNGASSEPAPDRDP